LAVTDRVNLSDALEIVRRSNKTESGSAVTTGKFECTVTKDELLAALVLLLQDEGQLPKNFEADHFVSLSFERQSGTPSRLRCKATVLYAYENAADAVRASSGGVQDDFLGVCL
jgi:hypothetical protein